MAKVKSIKCIGKEPVYNMEVENHHNFSVNGGLIVHNCRYGIMSRPNATQTSKTINIAKFPNDIQEDYNNASPEMKKHILKKLGLL